jgi:hypothetical protein
MLQQLIIAILLETDGTSVGRLNLPLELILFLSPLPFADSQVPCGTLIVFPRNVSLVTQHTLFVPSNIRPSARLMPEVCVQQSVI